MNPELNFLDCRGKLFKIHSVVPGERYQNWLLPGATTSEETNKMNTIPEGSLQQQTQKPEEQQIEGLLRILNDHQAFKRCRGEFGAMPITELLSNETPTGVLRAFDDWASDQRVLLNMLAKLQRNGSKVAFDELMGALTSQHIIRNEILSDDKCSHAVLVMFEPEKLALLARWMYTSNLEDAIHWINNGCGDPKRGLCGSLTPKFFEVFPEIREKLIAQKNHSHVVSPTAYFYDEYAKDGFDRIERGFGRGRVRGWCLENKRTALWYHGNQLGLFVFGAHQKDILSLFSREEQKHISTWSFRYPECMFRAWYGIRIGIHHRSEHDKWKKRWPSYASRSCSKGFGAVLLNEKRTETSYLRTGPQLPEYPTLYYGYPGTESLGDFESQNLLFNIVTG
jgi:hypothetical protein